MLEMFHLICLHLQMQANAIEFLKALIFFLKLLLSFGNNLLPYANQEKTPENNNRLVLQLILL